MRHAMRNFIRCAVLLLALASPAFAQVATTHITGVVYDASGQPAPRVRLTITKLVKGGVVVSTKRVDIYSDASGNVDFTVLRNSTATFEANVVGLDRPNGVALVIPDSASVDFSALLPTTSPPSGPLLIHAATPASPTQLGHVKCGTGTNCDGDGTLSVTATGGAETLDELIDVQVTSPASGHALFWNGSLFVNRAPTKSDVGLGNVDNTSDANKPVSTAQQTALDAKASVSALTIHTSDTSNPHSVTKAQIGLSAVTNDAQLKIASNLSDLNSVSTARTNLGLGTAATLNAPSSGNAASGEVVKGSDTRLTDARTPTAHASSHAAAGSDPLTLSQSQITSLVSDLAGKQAALGFTPENSANKSTDLAADASNNIKYSTPKSIKDYFDAHLPTTITRQANYDWLAGGGINSSWKIRAGEVVLGDGWTGDCLIHNCNGITITDGGGIGIHVGSGTTASMFDEAGDTIALTAANGGAVQVTSAGDTTVKSAGTTSITDGDDAAYLKVDATRGLQFPQSVDCDALGTDSNGAVGCSPTAATQSYVDTGLAGKQPLNSNLTALAGLALAANKLPYATGVGAFSLTDFSSFGRSLVDDADASAARTTLGLGTMATQAETNYALLAGRSGGQTLTGGTGVTDVAAIKGTSGNGTSGNTGIKLLVGNNGATEALTVLNSGLVGVNKSSSAGAQLHVVAKDATTFGQIIQMAASPNSTTGLPWQIQDSTGLKVSYFDTAGRLLLPSGDTTNAAMAFASAPSTGLSLQSSMLTYVTGGSTWWAVDGGTFRLRATNVLGWVGSGNPTNTLATSLSPVASGVLQVGDGGANANGTLKAKSAIIGTATAKGTCDSTARGTLYTEFGGAGVADKIYQCLKSSSDTYSWVQIVSAP